MADEKRIALLIDAENISAQYADYIIGEVDNYGICSYKRIYGSWDRIVKTKWEGEIRKNSLKAMMQINNTKGKNSTDSALIIDAMDILYRGNVDGFCIVSSDSDFTSLARRLMESGLMVIGMGESDKATEALENAYDKFVYIDLLAKQVQEEAAAEERQKKNAQRGAGRGVAESQGYTYSTSEGIITVTFDKGTLEVTPFAGSIKDSNGNSLGNKDINYFVGTLKAVEDMAGGKEDFSYKEGYLPLWQEWAKQNPQLMAELATNSKGKTLTDKFASTRVSQARALSDILSSNNTPSLTSSRQESNEHINSAANELEKALANDS